MSQMGIRLNVRTADAAAGTGVGPGAILLTLSFHRSVQRVASIARVSYDAADSVTTTTGRLPASMLHIFHGAATLPS